jgi:hypothetical protein
MSYELINKLRGFSTLRVVDGNATIELAALSANSNTENIQSAIITSLKWSVHPTAGNLKITRDSGTGAQTVANVFQTGFWSHDELNISNTASGNITVTLAGGGTTIITIRKDANYNVDTQLI